MHECEEKNLPGLTDRWPRWMAELCDLLLEMDPNDRCRQDLRRYLNWMQGQETLGVEYVRLRNPRFLASLRWWSSWLFELEEVLAGMPPDDPSRGAIAGYVAWLWSARRWA